MKDAVAQQSKWPAYPVYRPSGFEWLGEIPEHWEVKALKRVFRILNGSTPKSGEPSYWDGDIPWATPDDLGSLQGDTLFTTRRMITEDGYNSCGTSLAPAGSLVLSTRAPIGHLAIAAVPLCTNQGCRCLVFCTKDDTRFFYYQLLTARQELESLGQGSTFQELSRDKLGAVYLVAPPLDEQRAIAAFLDRETARIDELIKKKDRQIELLQEKRGAVISHAVTKGLNPNVKMKDSGTCLRRSRGRQVEWLGEIPEHWDVKRIRHSVTSIKNGTTTPQVGHDTEYMVTRIETISNGKIDYEKVGYVERDSTLDQYRLEINDILLSHINSLEMVGNCAIYRGEKQLYGGMNLLRLRPKTNIVPFYLLWWLKTDNFLYAIRMVAKHAINQVSVPISSLKDIPLPWPPLPEQRAIAAFLDRETARIDALIEKIRKSIELLREYRTALITTAVTGKIDVREEVK